MEGWGERGLSPQSREKSRLDARQVGAALAGEQRAVNADVADEHFEALLERRAGDPGRADVFAFAKSHAVRHRPSVALARDRAHLIRRGEALFVRGDERSEELAREFVPEVIEEILQRAADAAVVIRRAEQENIGPLNPGFKRWKRVERVSFVRIEEREGFGQQIQNIDDASGRG